MLEALLIGGIAFILSIIIGQPTIYYLTKFKILKNVSDDISERHHNKIGTPTMGGIQILLSTLIITGIFNLENRLSILLPFFAISACLLIGIVDDLRTTISNANNGLSWKMKLIYLLCLSTFISLILFYQLDVQSINLPILGNDFE